MSEYRHRLEKERDQPTPSPTPSRKFEEDKSAEQHIPAVKEVAIGRQALMKDLRKKETRKSLKRVSTPIDPPNRPLPVLPGRPVSPRRPPPGPRPQSPVGIPPPRVAAESRSPLPRRRITSEPFESLTKQLPDGNAARSRSAFEMKPPAKPLPPAPKAKSQLPPRKISSPVFLSKNRHDVPVTVQLVLTRSIKVDGAASTQDLVRAAANTFKLPEDSFALWCMKNGQLSALQDKDLEGILNSPGDSRETVYCYENKPE